MLKGIDVIELKILKREISRARQFGEGRHRAQRVEIHSESSGLPSGNFLSSSPQVCMRAGDLPFVNQEAD